jgi:phosphoribosyl-AMP cyclohydrolase
MTDWLDKIKWTEEGLLPAIAQDAQTGDVMMMAWMSAESLALTVETGFAVYWSRSRQALWKKGESSGNLQKIHSMHLDCDGDALLLKIDQIGGIACHTGRRSCFYRILEDDQWIAKSDILKDPSEMYKK